MVQGTSSWAGKSLLATALCRLIARRGVSVAPFKAQNMSNNARVVAGGEIGTAQWLQAKAAGVEADVRMNPVLVKPEADNQSQVVVMGRPDLALSRQPWRTRPDALWPVIKQAHASLSSDFQMLVIEGAGSPAEINLRRTDLANMRTAELADARVLLIADIERGGAFAHLYGTWALLDASERSRIAGFVLNKFRGDAALVEPGPRQLRDLTGVDVLGLLPRFDHGLPDEDGAATPVHGAGRPVIAIVRYPRASNLDEFKAVEKTANVRWVTSCDDLAGADLIVLPGSKNVAGDLGWLRSQGLDVQLRQTSTRILGICGGLQMLGERIDDPHELEGDCVGLDLLPVRTELARDKMTRLTHAAFGELPPDWSELTRRPVRGYEIRHGHTEGADGCAVLSPNLGWACGRVLGVYLHGLFEDSRFTAALLGQASQSSLDQELDSLADVVEQHLDLEAILEEVK